MDKKSIPIVKALNEELMQATFIVMVADTADLHGDITSEAEVRKACHNYNLFCRKANLFHVKQTEAFDIVESYIVPTDIQIDTNLVKKGTWVCVVQCNTPVLWELIKSGEVNGVSIGAYAEVEEIENTEGVD